MKKIQWLFVGILFCQSLYGQNDFSPAFSPDGKHISFYRYIDGVPELLIMNTDGSGVRQITEKTGLWSIGASWSEDGKYLHFSQGEGMATMDFSRIEIETKKVERANREGMQFSLGEYKNQVFWSSKTDDGFDFFVTKNHHSTKDKKVEIEGFEGSWLTPYGKDGFFINVSDDGLYLKNGKSQAQRIVPHKKIHNVSVSKNSEYVLFESEIDENTDIYMARTDGSELRRLTTNEYPDYMPAFSPDAKTIVFSSARSGSFCLYSMNLETKEITQLTGKE